MLSRGPENSQRLAVGIGHQEAGIDVRLGELAGYIQETMESYEVEVNGKTLPGEFLGSL